MRARLLILFVAVVSLSVRASDDPMPAAKNPHGGLPVGKWTIEFSNGVVEASVIRGDNTTRVEEPLRAADGKVEAQSGGFVLTFADDRVERWTPVGKKFVVEHWFPASRLPTATPVLGIAEPAK